MNKMQGYSVLKYKDFRYLKITALLIALAIAAYALITPTGGQSYGGSWLGYTLGILSTLIIFLLMWYGITKRSISGRKERRNVNYGAGHQPSHKKPRQTERRNKKNKVSWIYAATLQEWLSAHIYLGASLLVLVTLHTGFDFGFNVHTLAYLLLIMVISSGFYGLFVYLNYPRLLTLNMGADTLDDLLLKIEELDKLACNHALSLPDDINTLVRQARSDTRIGGTLWQQLSGTQHNCPTHLATKNLLVMGAKYHQEEQSRLIRDLYAALLRKEKLVLRARTEIMLRARMECWLYLHAPLGIAMVAALTAHIVSIFFYW